MKFSCSCKCFRFIRIFICCHLFIFRRQVFALFASNSSPITVRLGLVSDNIHFQYLQAQFNSLLVKYNSQYDVLPLFKIEGTTVCWNRGEPPSNRLKNLNRQLVLQNISAVLSLLPPNENELLASFLHGLSIPVLGSGSKEEQWYLRGKETDMYYPLAPSAQLQAAVIKDVILEFDQSSFVCITMGSHKDDLLIAHLKKYVMTNVVTPKCVTITSSSPSSIEEIFAALTAIKASGVQVIFVHGDAQDVKALLGIATKLSLKNLSDGFVWIFSDKAVQQDVASIPEHSIGITKTYDPESIQFRSRKEGFYSLLLRDGVLVFTSALESLMKKHHRELAFQCLNGVFQKTLRMNLNREIRESNNNGETGPISFGDTRERDTFRFSILKVRKKKTGDKEWQKIGFALPYQTDQDGPMVFEMFVPRDLAQPRRLKIATIEHTPFTMVREPQYSTKMGTLCSVQDSVPCIKYLKTDFGSDNLNKTETRQDFVMKCCHGILIDILLRVQKQTGFTFDLYFVRDDKFGVFDANTGKWNGLIGDVEQGKADMALATITITEERARYVDFTAPYMHTALSFLVQRERHTNLPFPDWINDMRLMKPFSYLLWLICVVTFFAIALTVWLMEKLKTKACTSHRNIKSGDFLPFEFMAYVFGNIFHVPLTRVLARTHSVPVLMVVVCFGALVLVSSYTANLTASLVLVEDLGVVSGVYDDKLVNPPPGFTFGTIRDTSIVEYFRKGSSPRLRKIYENMRPYNVDAFSDGIAQVKTGKLTAFIASYVTLSYYIAADNKCASKLDGKLFAFGGLGFPMAKNSSWREPISQVLLRMESKDEVTQLFEKWKILACKAQDGSQLMTAYSMGLDEFSGFLFNTAMCCCGSFLILLLEIIVYRKVTSNRQGFSIRTQTNSLSTAFTTQRFSTDISSTNISDVNCL